MKRVLLSTLTLLAATAAPALADGGDVGLRVENGAITTWEAQHSPLQFIKPERVFVGDFALVGGIVESEEPGFLIEPGNPLGGHRLGFNIRRATRVWDTASQDFSTISPLSITIERSLIGNVTTPLLDPPAPLTGLSFVVPTMGADFHYDFVLGGSSPGLYLLELEKWSEAPGVGTSLPFWIILNYDMPAFHEDAAVDWVNANLVPTPSSALALLAGGLLCLRRRR
jgi:hypothetical protein